MSDAKKYDPKQQEKEVKKLFEAYISVATHKLGRTPSIDEVTKMLGDEDAAANMTDQSPTSQVEHMNVEKSDEPSLVNKQMEPAKMSEMQDVGNPNEPKILKILIAYGNEEKDGKTKPNPHKILYFVDKDGNKCFNCEKQEWESPIPSIVGHLPTRPVSFNDSDMVSVIMNGIMDNDDYEKLDKAGMITENPARLWSLVNNLKKNVDELEKEELAKSEDDIEMAGDFEEENPDNEEWRDLDIDDWQSSGESPFAEMMGNADLSEVNGDIENDLVDEDVFREIYETAMSKALNNVESIVRKIVREELEKINSSYDYASEIDDVFSDENEDNF
jgi:hypothetical protein